MTSGSVVAQGSLSRQRVLDFVLLTKPRLVSMVLVATGVGFYLATTGPVPVLRMLETITGTALAAAGSLALNQYLEREIDGCMERTRSRPLPDGRLQAWEALVFGVVLSAAGTLYLSLGVDPLCGLITAITVVSYLFAYTPLKGRTSLCTLVGAVPGALPPVVGWAAAGGSLGVEAGVLFAILFFWQLPHSLAIAWLYRDEYAQAGMRLLPVVEPDGGSTVAQIMANSLALFAVALMPTLLGLAGPVYFLSACILGACLVASAVHLAWSRSRTAARRVLLATLAYLPLLLFTMALDKIPVT